MIVAGTLILLYEMYIADLVMTAAIAAYVLYQGFSLMPHTIKLLMGAVPNDVEFDAILHTLEQVDGVESVHHLHIWNLDEHRRALEAHVVPQSESMAEFEVVKQRVRARLSGFSIEHATLEPCLSSTLTLRDCARPSE